MVNYCPLLFLEQSGRNRTPDKLPAAERTPLLELCDRHLLRIVLQLRPRWLVGVGAFATLAARRVAAQVPAGLVGPTAAQRPRCLQILHPSPASPAANRGWAGTGYHRPGRCRHLGVSVHLDPADYAAGHHQRPDRRPPAAPYWCGRATRGALQQAISRAARTWRRANDGDEG